MPHLNGLESSLRLSQNIWAVPVTRLIGKRYTIIMSLVVFFVANIWTAKATSFGSIMGSRIVGGMFGGVIEALGPPIVEELFDRHELGRAMQIYVLGLGLGSVLGPISAGFITTDTGNWRNFFWLSVGLIGLNLLISIFMMPETSYPFTSNDRLGISEAGSTSSISQGRDGKGNMEDFREEAQEVSPPLSEQYQPTWWEVYMKNTWFLHHPHVHHPKSWVRLTLDPFRLLLVPGVLGLSLLFGTHIAWAVTTSVNVADHLGAPPYLWPSSHLGLMNLAPMTGIVVGAIFGGIGADYIANRAVRRAIKNGTHDEFVDENGNRVEVRGEPEARLPIILFAGIISPLGIVLTGYGMSHGPHWIAIAIPEGMGAFGITAACNVYLTYSIDSYKPYAAQLSVTVNVFKNCLGFAASYASVAWDTRVGHQPMFGTMSGIMWFVYLLIVPIYFYGKRIRNWTYNWLAPPHE